MPGTKMEKNKATDFDAAQEDREEYRRESEQNERQDLNQGGLDTGTHNTERHGVDWGRAYKTHAKEIKPKKKPNANSKSGA